jgi:hypothetical protein
MRVLLDECVPRPLKADLVGHEVSTVPKEQLSGLRNGKLLSAIENKWDVLLTSDTSIRWQQSIRSFNVGVLVVRANDNKLETLQRFVPEMLKALPFVKPGTVMETGDRRLIK